MGKPYVPPNHKGNCISFYKTFPLEKKGSPSVYHYSLWGNFNEIMEVLSHEQQRIKSLLPGPLEDRKFGIWHNWTLFSILWMRFKIWYGWVTVLLPSKLKFNIFKTFMWDVRSYFMPNSGAKKKHPFNVVCTDIWCGQFVVTQMFQRVKEVPANMPRVTHCKYM